MINEESAELIQEENYYREIYNLLRKVKEETNIDIEAYDTTTRVPLNGEELLTQLSTCYLKYGYPCHVIEDEIREVAKGIGLTANILVAPTVSLLSITHVNSIPLSNKTNSFFKTTYGINLHKVQLVDSLGRSLNTHCQSLCTPHVPFNLHLEILNIEGNTLDYDKQVVIKEKIISLSKNGRGFFHSSNKYNNISDSITGESDSITGELFISASESKELAYLFSSIVIDDAFKKLNFISNLTDLYPPYIQYFLAGLASAGISIILKIFL